MFLCLQEPVRLTITLPPGHTQDFTMGHLLMVQQQIALANGLPHLSILTEESTSELYYIRPIFQEIKTNPKPGVLKLQCDRDIARNSSGILDFHAFSQTLFSFAEVWIPSDKGGVFKGSQYVPFHLDNVKLCKHCFNTKVHLSMHEGEKRTTCPDMDRCRWCKQLPDIGKSFGNHIIKDCEGIKKLDQVSKIKLGKSIFPASNRTVVAAESQATLGVVTSVERSIQEVKQYRRAAQQKRAARKHKMAKKFQQPPK